MQGFHYNIGVGLHRMSRLILSLAQSDPVSVCVNAIYSRLQITCLWKKTSKIYRALIIVCEGYNN